jgi:hypothetical protein
MPNEIKIYCKYCKQELKIKLWNHDKKIAYCDNEKCPNYRQPVGAGVNTTFLNSNDPALFYRKF